MTAAQPPIKGQLRCMSQSCSEKMVDFRNHWSWDDQGVLLSFEESPRSLVPGIVAIVKGIQNPGVEQDRHSVLPKARALQDILGALGCLLFSAAKGASPRG